MKKLLEKKLEDIIWNSSEEDLNEAGLSLNKTYKSKRRQLRIGNYGRADIIYFYKNVDFGLIGYEPSRGNYDYYIDIVELKSEKITPDTICQAIRYAKGIKEFLYFRDSKINPIFRIILIGNEIQSESCYAFEFLSSESFNIWLYEYKINDGGISFELSIDNSLSNHGFKAKVR